MDGSYFVGVIAAVMTLSAFAYQLGKIVRTGETKALSYNLMIFVGIAMMMYFVFGLFYLNEPVVYVGNLIGFLINIFLIIVKYHKEHA